jgi:transposase-like protein
MGRSRRSYPPEFKEEAVRLVRSSNEEWPVSKIARDPDVSSETLRNWVRQAEVDAGECEGPMQLGSPKDLITVNTNPGEHPRYLVRENMLICRCF